MKKEYKIFIFGLFLLLIQSSFILRDITFIITDFITVYIIALFFWIYQQDLKKALIFSFIFSIFQDMMLPNINFFNFLSKTLIILFILSIKNKFLFKNIYLKSFVALVCFIIEIVAKDIFIFFKTSLFEFPFTEHILYILFNFLVFYAFYIFNQGLGEIGKG